MSHGEDRTFPQPGFGGLSKREYMATQLMAGLAADVNHDFDSPEQIARYAVALADALLQEL